MKQHLLVAGLLAVLATATGAAQRQPVQERSGSARAAETLPSKYLVTPGVDVTLVANELGHSILLLFPSIDQSGDVTVTIQSPTIDGQPVVTKYVRRHAGGQPLWAEVFRENLANGGVATISYSASGRAASHLATVRLSIASSSGPAAALEVTCKLTCVDGDTTQSGSQPCKIKKVGPAGSTTIEIGSGESLYWGSASSDSYITAKECKVNTN
jgi:hypothetical protein